MRIETYSQTSTPIGYMPTKLPRTSHFPDNLPANLEVKDTCPAVWTGQKLFDKRPADYARCIQMLAQGATIKQVAKACKISGHTVAIVRTRESEVLKESKKHLRGLIGTASQMAVEQMIEKLHNDQIPAGILPIAMGILIDKHRQYEGEPTQTIEVKKTLSLDEVRAELKSMRDEKIVEAEVTDIES